MSLLRRLLAPAAALLALAAGPLVPGTATAAPPRHSGVIAPGDPNLRYVGRWDRTDPTTYIGNWESPYVAAAFTGTTIKALVRDKVGLYVSIDGAPDTYYPDVSGTVDLTPVPLPRGVHSIWLSYRTGEIPTCATWPSPCATFQGFQLDRGARTVPRRHPRATVEFVGDSITLGALSSKNTVSSYSWLTGQKLGVDHTNISRSSACLVDIPGTCFGLNANFGKRTIGGTEDWSFAGHRADAVVVNLGTNDAGRGVSAADFQAAYTAFLADLRARYPRAALYAFETLRQRYVPETQAAVAARRAAGDANVHYIPTEGWLTDADYVDGGHPNDGGHAKIAERLAPVLAPALGLRLDGAPSDRNLAFTGRWDTSDPATYQANWAGSYVTARFTGAAAALLLRGTIDVWVSTDGGPDVLFAEVSGRVDVTPEPLAPGAHTMRIAYRNVDGSYRGDAVFQGLVLAPGAHTLPARPGRKLIEFVGDSITRGSNSSKTTLTSYGWLVGERLGTRHTHIAYGGGCLVSAADGCAGVHERFFHQGFAADSPLWDFDRYRADAVVVNLGTNDLTHLVTPADFQATYEEFLRQVRAVYPGAEILVLGTFVGRYLPETEAAVAAVGDPHTSFVDTVGWLPPEGLTDRVHPNDLGHTLIADRLTPIVADKLHLDGA